jgi:hypothetical protein
MIRWKIFENVIAVGPVEKRFSVRYPLVQVLQLPVGVAGGNSAEPLGEKTGLGA